jgi:hypothetical protein
MIVKWFALITLPRLKKINLTDFGWLVVVAIDLRKYMNTVKSKINIKTLLL